MTAAVLAEGRGGAAHAAGRGRELGGDAELEVPAAERSPDYTPATSRIDGRVKWVQLDVDEAAEDADHYLSAAERYRVAMALQ